MTAKIMSAVGSFVTGILLTVINFNTDSAIQSAFTLKGLFFITVFGAGISSILGAIPLLLCKFKGQERDRVVSEFMARRAETKMNG